jgi:cobalt-precorrin 5A hydrolase
MSAAQYCAGIGCRRGCGANALRELLERALQSSGLRIDHLTGLASIDNKRAEPGLLALAVELNLPLTFFSAAQLKKFEDRLQVPSAAALRATGVAGIAATSALALAESRSGTRAELVVEKYKSAAATVALARIGSHA